MTASSKEPGLVIAGTDQIIHEVDDAYLEVVGWDRGDLIGKKVLSFTYKADIERNQPGLDRISAGGPAFTIQKRYVRQDKSIVWVSNHVTRLTTVAGSQLLLATTNEIARPFNGETLSRNHSAAKRLCDALIAGKASLGADIVAAPMTELLLWLYRAEFEASAFDVDQLAHRIDASTRVAGRWLNVLEERGLVEREPEGPSGTVSAFRISQYAERAIDSLLKRSS